ncbi:peptidase domain-containing ABC transporter [soil metagenome]
MRAFLLRLFSRNRNQGTPVYLQRDSADCGTTCLAMILAARGVPNAQRVLRGLAGVSSTGLSLRAIADLARGVGIEATGFRVTRSGLQDMQLPVIAHLDGNHFVVVTDTDEHGLTFNDPAIGKSSQAWSEFESRWQGVLLAFSRDNLPGAEWVNRREALREAVANDLRIRRDAVRALMRESLVGVKQVLGFAIAAIFGYQLVGLAPPLLAQAIVDRAVANRSLGFLLIIAAAFVVVGATQLALGVIRSFLLTHARSRWEVAFFAKTLDHVLSLKQRSAEQYDREDFLSRFNSNASFRQIFTTDYVAALLDVPLVFTYTIILFLYHPAVGSTAALTLVALIGVAAYFIPRLRVESNRVFQLGTRATGSFLDSLTNGQTIRLLNASQVRLEHWNDRFVPALNAAAGIEIASATYQVWLTAIVLGAQASATFTAGWYTIEGQLTIGQFVAITALFATVTARTQTIVGLWTRTAETLLAFDRLADILTLSTEVEDRSRPVPSIESIELVKLSYVYDKKKASALTNISLYLRAGEHVTILGANGSGKSTLLRIIAGLYDDYDGPLLVNGIDRASMTLPGYRSRIGVIPQEVQLFRGTVADNIRIARPGATEDEIIEAARLSGVLAPDGRRSGFSSIDLPVATAGSNLSGGQRLRIAFARVLLCAPDVIILDEASSSLDPLAERELLAALTERFADKLIVSAAHRAAATEFASRVIVLDGGKVVQDFKRQPGESPVDVNAVLALRESTVGQAVYPIVD